MHTQFVRQDNLDLFDRYRRNMLCREAHVVKAIKPGGKLLDVGCATGTFFASFDPGRWRLYGIDISYVGVDIARTKYQAEVTCGTLNEVRFPAAFFDVVSMLDTLYYSPDPLYELREIRRVLRDDGLLVLEIPGFTYSLLRDRGPICWIFDRRRMRGFTECNHLYYFSPSSMKELLKSAGFRVMKVAPEQASISKGGVLRVVNEIHFALARLLFAATVSKFSIAGKELYLAVKTDSSPS